MRVESQAYPAIATCDHAARDRYLLHVPNVQRVLIVVHSSEADIEQTARNSQPECCSGRAGVYLELRDELSLWRKLDQFVRRPASEDRVAIRCNQVAIGCES